MPFFCDVSYPATTNAAAGTERLTEKELSDLKGL
jgi:hypothetical protein